MFGRFQIRVFGLDHQWRLTGYGEREFETLYNRFENVNREEQVHAMKSE